MVFGCFAFGFLGKEGWLLILFPNIYVIWIFSFPYKCNLYCDFSPDCIKVLPFNIYGGREIWVTSPVLVLKSICECHRYLIYVCIFILTMSVVFQIKTAKTIHFFSYSPKYKLFRIHNFIAIRKQLDSLNL